MHKAIDVLGFAGGFTLGMVQAGFELVGKRELPGGFGVANCEANRHLLGYEWRAQATKAENWSPIPADVVFGNPPCSAFSVMSDKNFRGAGSKVEHCMWSFVEYAAKVKPLIAVFESVQPARTRPDGHDLMLRLRSHLEDLSGERYNLHHVRHNAYSIGGCSERKRYFWVASRIPFGVEVQLEPRYPVLWDAISDLEHLENTWNRQPYGSTMASWWASLRKNQSGEVDGHRTVENPLTGRIRDLMNGVTWEQGQHISQVARAYWEKHHKLPQSWASTEEKLIKQDFFMGFTTPVRWRADRPARVITGGGLIMAIHPTQPRTFTHREVARVMGFPDDWDISPLQGTPGLGMTWGKGITVDCGRWIGKWIKNSIDGAPGALSGELIGDREFDIDVTGAWKESWYSEQSKEHSAYSRRPKGTSMTETAEGVEATEQEAPTRNRARGQRTNTAELDERTYEFLAEARTRDEVEATLELTPAQAYLSMDRLRKAGRVAQERRDGKSVWFHTEVAVA